MSTIGGPGGIGGPKGPKGPDDASSVEDVDAARTDAVDDAGSVSDVQAPDVEALANEIAAGRLTPREAIERLVDATAGPELDAADRAELREMLTDLVANDPYLGRLVGRI